MKLADIHPDKNPAFSPNLYRWMRHHRNRPDFVTLFDGPDKALYLGRLCDDHDDFAGARIMAVLCNGAKEPDWAMAHLRRADFTEVKGFWANYLRIGRCAIDPFHEEVFIDDDKRWHVWPDGHKRVCVWCGAVQLLERYTHTEERSRWVTP